MLLDLGLTVLLGVVVGFLISSEVTNIMMKRYLYNVLSYKRMMSTEYDDKLLSTISKSIPETMDDFKNTVLYDTEIINSNVIILDKLSSGSDSLVIDYESCDIKRISDLEVPRTRL